MYINNEQEGKSENERCERGSVCDRDGAYHFERQIMRETDRKCL